MDRGYRDIEICNHWNRKTEHTIARHRSATASPSQYVQSDQPFAAARLAISKQRLDPTKAKNGRVQILSQKQYDPAPESQQHN